MSLLQDVDTFTLARGFRATATACGLKPSGALDLALIAADRSCSAAGMFTTNRVKAAPVRYNQRILEHNAHSIRAIITNSGMANACTGDQGMADAEQMAALTAYGLHCQPDEILVLSTGVIGKHLEMDKLTQGIAEVTAITATEDTPSAARAIMTTDTRPKVAGQDLHIGGETISVRGICKGSGMIHPNMATMLALITTDASIEPSLLQQSLRYAVQRSFNRISVDGDTSTNDTVFLLASGASGTYITENELTEFNKALTEVCISLAKQIVNDGEGATRLVEIIVTGAVDEAQAHVVANSIARSPLVKTAIHGGDPNWGRILCAAGYSGAAIDSDRLTLAFGPPAEIVTVVEEGLPTDYDERDAATALRGNPVYVRLDLGLGAVQTTVWTCDLSTDYIRINALYTT
ncbi:MAG: bifunctional glutamate N-acetyltransferase/amino-acid acetyltransferase ArgJ [Chloroflexi bacterium AL-W]|nr:bifunctional glutamate N-acetyltransferase/amino-acid acetyltransferase ArgJ [Chloroflexi bacterium AL-N1]NOK67145.1 bifunctional glutamate N-acetyltransferase/amino-acid acetyltransferase ArgJ [Chloroflexi bacterium AL-N10]NOK74562.1 bifunctional glutamate N-acetyltransferase/amino-acid acetyltransferase ArgJ [Chloroflexi bacterium AL-N5]NOK81747.1 bifunctional glutamate N-acetyltransferase/amino-acid acetyltransferase ArgJ [Chloroflexi bacterium AL-W]NOK89217.1 bifunctional glutamate N-ace